MLSSRWISLVFVTFVVCTVLSTTTGAQWLPANRAQTQELNGNGALYVHNGIMYLWNEEHQFQYSTDNGATWVDTADSLQGANPHVSKITGSGSTLYAGLNFGTGNGIMLKSTNEGQSWQIDTLGAPGHALGWGGMPVVRDLAAFGKYLYVCWDGPNYYDIQEDGGAFVRNTYMATGGNQPQTVCTSGDTLFCCSNKLYYTVDGGKNFIVPQNTNYPGPGLIVNDGGRLYVFCHRVWNQPEVMSYSDDHGDTWTDVDISAVTSRRIVNGDLYAPIAAFFKGQRIELAFGMDAFGKSPNCWKSTDLGATWSVDTLGLLPAWTPTISCFAYTDDGYLWCSPSYNNIFKQQIDAGTVNTVSDTKDIPAATLYPQPADDVLTVKSSLLTNAGESMRIVEVCNQLGQRELRQELQPTEQTSILCTSLANGFHRVHVLFTDGHCVDQGFIVRHK